MEAVEMSEYKRALARIETLESEMKWIKILLTRETWLTTPQTIAALNVSDTTLYRLRMAGAITWKKEGKKISYDINSVRAHMEKQRIESWAIDRRVLEACQL